jgi:Transposase, Mutator family
MTDALGAAKGERSEGRLGYRSGYYGRTLITRVGKLEAPLIGADLNVPDDVGCAETISEASPSAIRTVQPPGPPKPKGAPPAPRQFRSPGRESIQRRRRVASSGAMPTVIAAQFTEAERAVLLSSPARILFAGFMLFADHQALFCTKATQAKT